MKTSLLSFVLLLMPACAYNNANLQAEINQLEVQNQLTKAEIDRLMLQAKTLRQNCR